MKLNKFFTIQGELDETIKQTHKLEGVDLIPDKILALYTEIGELANEWQGFKFWKVNNAPKKDMLEEYVDVFHFLLSLAIEFKTTPFEAWRNEAAINERTVGEQFQELLLDVSSMYISYKNSRRVNQVIIEAVFAEYFSLGALLGFDYETIQEAYLRKNETNHVRQLNNY